MVAAGVCARAQQPRFPPGFQRPGQNAPPDPAEASAYQAAVAKQNPGERVSALQQFLAAYPNSSMRQSAIAELLAAQRQSRDATPTPVMNHPPAAPAPAAAAVAPAAPVSTPAQAYGPPKDSLLQQAPKEAQITVAPHSLSIKADNSALSQILHDIANSTGMRIDGLSKDERVFGSYGPGEARDVLLALLEGSGYNVVMVGGLADGAPRELNLSQRTTASSAASGATPRTSAQEEADDEQDVQQAPMPPETQPLQPAQNNPPGPDNGQQPRSPQEILQELQRLRQQNLNQPQPPPQSPQQ
jgi:hypothetical protein